VLKWDGSTWACAADADTQPAWSAISGMPAGFADGVDDDTVYSAGAGIRIDASNVISSTLGTSISTVEIDDGAVTSAKIADGSVTAADLAPNIVYPSTFSVDPTQGRLDGPVFTTNGTPVGWENNALFNATTRYAVTQTGASNGTDTAQFSLPELFDGNMQPQYPILPPTDQIPTVITISGLPNFHVQRGAWVGFTTRYWQPIRFKIEGNNTYTGGGQTAGWKVLADYSTTPAPETGAFFVRVDNYSLTDLRFTFYEGTGPNQRIGLSELLFIHPEIGTPYAGLTRDIGLQLVTTSCNGYLCTGASPVCPAGKKVISGGCECWSCPGSGADVNRPSSTLDGWVCKSNSCQQSWGYAVCAYVK
jgi:hypothetical protein